MMKIFAFLLGCLLASVMGSDYIGCFSDSAERAMTMRRVDDATSMTVRKCRAICLNAGYLFAAAQYGKACFCGDSGYGRHGAVRPDSECNMSCPGDSAVKCGGFWRNSVYKANPYPNSRYIGCFVDLSALGLYREDDRVAMTIEKCLGVCHRRGYNFATIQAGYACICMNNGVDKYGPEVAETDCSVACTGNPDQKCGARQRSNVYSTGI